jgi:hypothetical protein
MVDTAGAVVGESSVDFGALVKLGMPEMISPVRHPVQIACR